MSEYPIQFKDGSWGWKHALDDDWEPDFEEERIEEELKKEQERS